MVEIDRTTLKIYIILETKRKLHMLPHTSYGPDISPCDNLFFSLNFFQFQELRN